MESREKITLAILGGGLSGVTLLRALLPHPNIDAHIFESRPEFKEEGAAIGFQPNALHTLNTISPSLIADLNNAGAVDSAFKSFIGVGPNAGQRIWRNDALERIRGWEGISHKSVARHSFLREMLMHVPPERMHAKMRMERLEELEGGVRVHFADGSCREFDVVIGADGIHSSVRRHVLPPDHPALEPAISVWANALCLVPSEQVISVLGADVMDKSKPAQVLYAGEYGQAMLLQFVAGMEMVCIILVWGNQGREHARSVSRSELLGEFEKWPRHLGVDIVNMVADKVGEPIGCWSLTAHNHAPSYVRGNVALMGDAAHATVPWQGSGGGMAIEDTLVLAGVLGNAKSKGDVAAGLRAYDKIRIPRTQRVVDSSYGTGLISSGLDPETGLDAEKMAAAKDHRWDFIRDFDPVATRDEAVRLMDTELAR